MEPPVKPTMEATAIATMEPLGEVVPPAMANIADAPEPVVEEEPEAVATPAVIEETPPVATIPPTAGEAGPNEEATDGPVPLTLPWADFPDNVALLAREASAVLAHR